MKFGKLEINIIIVFNIIDIFYLKEKGYKKNFIEMRYRIVSGKK